MDKLRAGCRKWWEMSHKLQYMWYPYGMRTQWSALKSETKKKKKSKVRARIKSHRPILQLRTLLFTSMEPLQVQPNRGTAKCTGWLVCPWLPKSSCSTEWKFTFHPQQFWYNCNFLLALKSLYFRSLREGIIIRKGLREKNKTSPCQTDWSYEPGKDYSLHKIILIVW